MAQKLTRKSGVHSVKAKVNGPADVLWSAQLGREFAASMGFSAMQCDEIGLAVTELASNLVRHAAGGAIHLSQIREGQRLGIEIQSSDRGPGIANVEQAMLDGFSTAGGFGLGLGTVNRLTDKLEISPAPKGGTQIICRRWLPTRSVAGTPGGLAFGAATRSFAQAPENGDTYIFKEWGPNALVGVIDGLGHGPFAEFSSQTARTHVEQHFEEPLEVLFKGADVACRATRGVVMALARFDLVRQKLMVASVGNIEVRLWGMAEPFDPAIRRGIVGQNAAKPHATEHTWTANSMLIMFSDGVRKDWDWNTYRNEMRKPPRIIAQRLLNEHGRTDDDATVIVARSAV